MSGDRVKLGGLLLAYLALALAFARATPPLEASDEARHLGFVVHLARHGTLPVVDASRPGLAAHEALQPPLYYAIGAALVGPRRLRDAERFYVPMPGSTIGRADLPGTRFMFTPPDARVRAARSPRSDGCGSSRSRSVRRPCSSRGRRRARCRRTTRTPRSSPQPWSR